MLSYWPLIISMFLNAFMLGGLPFLIQLNVTFALVYSILFFCYFYICKREKNGILILLSALAYGLLINFVLNVRAAAPISDESIWYFSFTINLIFAIIFFVILLALTLLLALSFFPILLMGHSFWAAIMYFNGWSLSYFIVIYLASVLALSLIPFLLAAPTKTPFNSKPYVVIWLCTFILFIASEAAYNSNFISFTLLANYNFINNFIVLSSFFFALFDEIIVASYDFEVLAPNVSALSESLSDATKQLWNEMWRGGRSIRSNSSLAPSSKSTSCALYGWGLNSTAQPSLNSWNSNLPSLSSHFTAAWARISNFMFSYNFFSNEPQSLPSDLEISSIITEEKKNTSKALSVPDRRMIRNCVSAHYGNSTPLIFTELTFEAWGGRTTTSVAIIPQGMYNNFIREYATSSKNLALGYLLKAEFMTWEGADSLISKIKSAPLESFLHTYIDEKRIPILQGMPGKHHMVIIVLADEAYDVLLILTTAPSICLVDSTYTDYFKNIYGDGTSLEGLPLVKTQCIVEELHWRIRKVLTVTNITDVDVKKTNQNIAPTFILVEKNLTRDLQNIGERKDPVGTEKVQSLASQIKEQAEVLAERSRLLEDPTKIKVVVISKK